MAEYPLERAPVALDDQLEYALRPAIDASLTLGRRVAQEPGAHHRGEGEGNHGGDQDGDPEGDRELAEEAAHHVRHEEERG